MLKTMIVATYAGCGKTWLAQNSNRKNDGYDFTCRDSDSSKYDKSDPLWTKRYVADIKSAIGKFDFIFVGMHNEFRRELHEQGIPFVTVAPNNADWTDPSERLLVKQQWFGRFLLRDNSHIKNFPVWLIHQVEKYDEYTSIEDLTLYNPVSFFLLNHDQYLSDIIDDLYWKKEHYDMYDAASRRKGEQ